MVGKTILHYKILEKLGEGGMGIVYLADDTKLKRKVAIKFLPHHISVDEEELQRFEVEAQAAASLNHPNIATVYAIEEGEDSKNGRLTFIVMEYIEGKELKEVIHNNSPLRTDDIINYAVQIAMGLEAAHKKGIVHRDIKSSNIMITNDDVVKIMDFGLAKIGKGSQLTKMGTTIGTIEYMSPEQARGGDIDHRTDIWSFGVVLYEMVTTQMPFRGDYEQAVIYSLINEKPQEIPTGSTGLNDIVYKALEKQPDKRYHSAGDILIDLHNLTEGKPVRKIKGRKKIKLSWIIVSVLIILTVILLFLFFPFSPKIQKQNIVKTIAVLPFVDLSPLKDQEYLTDGLAEEILDVLAKIPDLRVISRTSSFSFRGKNLDIKTIAKILNVHHILEGSVQKAGNRYRITAQLVDVSTDAYLWSNSFDSKLNNLFALQDSISSSVAAALKVTLFGENSTEISQRTNPEAYKSYLMGVYFFHLSGNENKKKAIDYFNKTLAIDSAYAPAWISLSIAHSNLADNGNIPLKEGYAMAGKEIKRALASDPNSGYAYAQIGWIKRSFEWNWKGADSAFQHALKLDPGNSSVIHGAASLDFTMGRVSKALDKAENLININPTSAGSYLNLGYYEYSNRELVKSFEHCGKVLELNRDYPFVHCLIGCIYIEKGQPEKAIAEIFKERDPIWKDFGLALAYSAAAQILKADSALTSFINKYHASSAYQIAEIYSFRKEKDKVFEWLEKAYEIHDTGLAEIKSDPLMKNIKDDPRYRTFLNKMRLPI